MKIGIAGGTGGMGEGFALRWCQKHDVIVGSRDAQKAREAQKIIPRQPNKPTAVSLAALSGNDNISFAKDIDVLILSIPYEFIDDAWASLQANSEMTVSSSRLLCLWPERTQDLYIFH